MALKRRIGIGLVLLAWVVGLLTGCGGGSGSAAGSPQTVNKWDSMKWDEGKWE